MRLRRAVQALIILLSVSAGYRLYVFVGRCLGGGPAVARPAMVGGFLPIGGLMGLKLWLRTGLFDRVHPAAMVILGAAMLVSVLFKKGFCSWICPVGALSEALWKTGEKIFPKRDFRLNRLADCPLRSVKYFLLAFFVFMVFSMPSQSLAAFLNGPYWVAADARMLWFFEYMGATAGLVIAGLFVGSFLLKNFWCRYFCPYGALLGLLSLLSPMKITRDEAACSGCGACAKKCPARIPTYKKTRVRTPECSGCLSCLAACPVPGALGMRPGKTLMGPLKFCGRSSGKDNSRPPAPFPPLLYAALLAAVFFGVIAWAIASGHWTSQVTYAESQKIIPMMRNF